MDNWKTLMKRAPSLAGANAHEVLVRYFARERARRRRIFQVATRKYRARKRRR